MSLISRIEKELDQWEMELSLIGLRLNAGHEKLRSELVEKYGEAGVLAVEDKVIKINNIGESL